LEVQKIIENYNAINWSGLGKKKPVFKEILEVFIPHTTWYEKYNKNFAKVVAYEDMMKWLQRDEDAPSTKELWGFDKEDNKIGFPDLQKWLKRQEEAGDGEDIVSSDSEKIAKPKKKEKSKDKGKGKEKEVGPSKNKVK
jgi:hypothetical protein